MITRKAPYYLVKIIDNQWANKLLDGEIFMRSISCFAPIENWIRNNEADPTVQNSFRGDNMEGYVKSFEKGGSPLDTYDENGRLRSRDVMSESSSGLIDMLLLREKIYCLYSLEYDEVRKQFIQPSSEVLNFGDTAVIITDTTEFLRRVNSAIGVRYKNVDYRLSYCRVDYDIEQSSGDVYNEFQKSKAYKYQKEFRVALDLSEGLFDRRRAKSSLF